MSGSGQAEDGYAEAELLPISALQHLVFCERQCALIHIERIWEDNLLTVEGTHLHRRAHETGPRRENRQGIVVARSLRVRSRRLGLTGICDVVEFRAAEGREHDGPHGSELPRLPGRWTPFPIEYKRGRPRPERCDDVQLCAQALCLEEMLGAEVPEGAIFYGRPRRRHWVNFDFELRATTERQAARLRELLMAGITPRVRRMKKCGRCSLVEVCQPSVTGIPRSVNAYIATALAPGPALEEGDL